MIWHLPYWLMSDCNPDIPCSCEIYRTPSDVPSCVLLAMVCITGAQAVLRLLRLLRHAPQLDDTDASIPQAVVASTCMQPAAPVGLVVQFVPPRDSFCAIDPANAQSTPYCEHAATSSDAIRGLVTIPPPIVPLGGVIAITLQPPSSHTLHPPVSGSNVPTEQ